MTTSFDNEVNILIGGVAPNHALRSALGTDHLIFEYEFFFQHHYLQEFFHQNKSLQESLCSEWCHNKTWSTDFTHSFRRLAVSFIVYCSRYVGRLSFDWQWIKSISCLAKSCASIRIGDGPSNFSGGTWAIYSEFEFLIFSVTICKKIFHQNKSLQEFFLSFNVILLYQEKKPLCAEWSKSILKEIIMFQKCV